MEKGSLKECHILGCLKVVIEKICLRSKSSMSGNAGEKMLTGNDFRLRNTRQCG